MANRRKVIKSAVGITTVGIISQSTKASKSDVGGIDQIGISDEVEELLQTGKINQAEQLMESHGVNYSTKKLETGGDREFEAQGRYSESNSELYMSLVEKNDNDDLYLVSTYGTLSTRRARIRDAAVIDDACGIGWDSNEWTARGRNHLNYIANSDASGGADIERTDFDANYGVTWGVDLPRTLGDDTNISLQADLYKTGPTDQAPVYFDYIHTYTFLGEGPFGIDIHVDILDGSLGRLGIDLVDAYEAWDAELEVSKGEDRDEW
ncbi:hypothetical protein [Natronolimnohabitans innermongolicus]|uniref:hypothetical protein n=1 Tax=Natronolimnohabitans innermongolicus TaxID=253107 RepID=UPI001267D687|nr:hypothetical protein [Natronolimnohabitans innermongolicus]